MRLKTKRPIRGFESKQDSQVTSDGSRNGGSQTPLVLGFVLASLVLTAGLLFTVPNNLSPSDGGSNFFSRFGTWTTGTVGPTGTSTLILYSPLILNGSADVPYPADYDRMATFALGLINKDRADFNLSSVQQTSLNVAQQHADSMLRYGYFSHWDTQGYKPYIRYSLLGGRGAVAENIAYASVRPGHYSSASDVEPVLRMLESSMMYNDSVCCNDGHRENILNPLHTRVSIGIAYNYTTVFFAEDFENYYFDLAFSVDQSYAVSIGGSPVGGGSSPTEVLVTFDATPAAESPYELNTGPSEYDPGTVIGGVLPPCTLQCSRFIHGVTEYATAWTFTPTQAALVFSLSKFVEAKGAGVYTIYILEGNDTGTALTSISVFVKG